MGLPRVAWLTPFVPDRNGGGGQIRQAYLLRALSETAAICLYSNQPLTDPAVQAAVLSFELVDVPAIDWGKRSKWSRRLRDLMVVLHGREPREVANFYRFRSELAGAVEGLSADAVIVEYAGLAPLIHHRFVPEQPWILTLHNVGSVMEMQEAAVYNRGRQAWLHRRDARIWGRWESEVPSLYDRLVTVSTEDAHRFHDRVGRPPAVVPNGVDTERFQFTEPPTEPSLIFTGALNTGPNFDGLLWFCDQILPLIQAQHEHVSLDIVGSNPPPQIRQLSLLPGVSLHADVPDVLPYLRKARVSIVPLRIGSGTRLKALEAMAAGRPVVGTSIGLDGLNVSHGVHAEIADQPQAFSDSVCRLLGDDGRVTDLTTNARRLVEAEYSWDAIGSQFVEVIEDALS